MALALFILGLVAVLLAWHVHHPVRRPGELAVVMFPAAWLGGELPIHCALLFGAGGVALAVSGGLEEPAGVIGLVLLVASALGPVRSWRQADEARALLSKALGREVAPRESWWRLALPLWFHDREVVARPRVLREGERMRADLYRPRHGPATPQPLLVYVHGGGWVLGFRRLQGRLLIRRLVRSGWVAVSIQYRLSPWATWPDHIIDVKRAIAWARRMAPTWGADPDRVAISGNSAGGHLATLAAFSQDIPAWQPGFEADDTRVQALVSWYGIYDLVAAVDPTHAARWTHGGLRRLWRLLVMKRPFGAAGDDYRQASPHSHFGAHVPPTLLVHGELDTLVPVSSARAFADECERAFPGRVRYLEIPGAEHAFEVFTSRRGAAAVEAAALWLEAQLAAPTTEPRRAAAVPDQKF